MDPASAFMMSIAFAYASCIVLALSGKQPLVGVPFWLQCTFYAATTVIFISAALGAMPRIAYWPLGAFYAYACVATYCGTVKWAAFWKPPPHEPDGAMQVSMSLLDLAISVIFFMLA